MVTIAYWNVRSAGDYQLLAAACRENDVDIAILSECKVDTWTVTNALNKFLDSQYYYEVPSNIKRVRFFTRCSKELISMSLEDEYYSIAIFSNPTGFPIIICGAHLPSNLHSSSNDRHIITRRMKRDIESIESRSGHQNSLIIGDMNANPFDPEICSADGLHGVLDKSIALRNNRVVQGIRYSFFYNPMWNKFGDDSAPAGTYYYRSATAHSLFWHLYDQVLIRPSLVRWYNSESVKILTSIGEHSLLSDRNRVSPPFDHLPLLIRMQIEGEFQND